jgi:small-conductance mechanosensitive channel
MSLSPFEIGLIKTLIAIIVLILLRGTLIHLTKRYARKIERVEQRTGLIIKHINYATVFCIALVIFFIWGVDFDHLGSVFLSVFAVIGVGFFAQWSILTNITSGIIMFFIFPYKIGDYIKIHDKENDFQGTIEDIKTFHVILRTSLGEMITYPNSLIIQKGVSVVKPEEIDLIDILINHEEKPEDPSDDKNVKEQPID